MRLAIKPAATVAVLAAAVLGLAAKAAIDAHPARTAAMVKSLKFTLSYPYGSLSSRPVAVPTDQGDFVVPAQHFGMAPQRALPGWPLYGVQWGPAQPYDAAIGLFASNEAESKAGEPSPPEASVPVSKAAVVPVQKLPPAKPAAVSKAAVVPVQKLPPTKPALVSKVAVVTGQKLPPAKPARTARARHRSTLVQIAFDAPTLAPLAHTRFCLKYPADCRTHKILFRGGPIELTDKRRAELERVNAHVNRAIKPERMNEAVAQEKWLISPKVGDCNDYAVTKRHELLSLGWPARALLLAEVVTSWGEHHLVLVVRTRQGDLVADSLDKTIRNWSETPYQWVRIETPANPMYWSTLKAAQPELVASAASDHQL